MSSQLASSVQLKININRQPCWILNLPEELLCALFEAVACIDPPRKHDVTTLQQGKPHSTLGFLRLSEVCTRFRALLLSMPRLWADIAFRVPIKYTKLALARSRRIPLTVHINIPHHSPQRERQRDLALRRFVELAIEHIARIRSLSVVDLPAVHHKQLLGGPLPLLESLRLRYDTDSQLPYAIGELCINAPLLRVLFLRFAPEMDMELLHNLERGMTFKFPALQSLNVSIHTKADTGATPRWIPDILKVSPHLHHLVLDVNTYAEPINWSVLFNGQQVSLKHLQLLQLRGTPFANMAELYSCLSSPEPARFMMCFAFFKHTAGAVQRTVTAFSPPLQHASHNGLLVKLRSIGEKQRELTLRIFPAMSDLQQYSDHWPPSAIGLVELIIWSALSSDDPAHEQVTEILARALQFGAVKQLVVDAPGAGVWPTAVDSIAAACTSTTELVVRNNRSKDSPNGSLPLPDAATSFPALDTVVFFWHDESVEDFIGWLEMRSSAGRRVRCLHIAGLFDHSEADDEACAAERDRATCGRMAGFVDEFVDERRNSVL